MSPLRDAPDWFPDWSSDVCAIVASGPSVTQADVDKLRGCCRVAVVNNNHELAPWADVLYAADGKWWDHYPTARTFAGVKVTPDAVAEKRYGLHRVGLIGDVDADTDRISIDRPGWIARGGNSAFQLVNLVTQFGSRRQLWIGFDFHGEHWHGNHPAPLKNPRAHTLEKWRARFEAQATILGRLGVEVINASQTSALTEFSKMSIDAALVRWNAGDENRKGVGSDRVAAAGQADRDSSSHDQGQRAMFVASP